MITARRDLLLAEGTAVFGKEGIEAIVEHLDDGFMTAVTALDYDGPKGPVELKIVTDELQQESRTAVWGSHDHGTIQIGLNPKAQVPDILEVLPRYGCHEMAHKIHFSHPAPRATWGLGIPFMTVIKEGFATHTEQLLHGTGYRPASYLSLPSHARSAYYDDLLRAIYGPTDETRGEYWRSDKGINVHEVGTYVVGLMAVVHSLEPRDLVKLPLATFQEFVEHEL